jgi:hypothetical protein
MSAKITLLSLILATAALAQQSPSPELTLMQTILKRMDALEQQNRDMAKEIHELRQQLHPDTAPLDEQVAVTENRVEEQSQSKVEAFQKLPVTISGQVLFNAFANSGHIRALPEAVYPSFISSTNTAGATVQQTMLGFDFRGPSIPGNGKVDASIRLDFYPNVPSQQLQWIRMRTSDISLDWQNRSLTFAFDKPLISPRQPNSLAEVAIPPLAGAGNLWLWLPQIRYQERFKLGSEAGINLQGAALETDETLNYVPNAFTSSLEKSRPAIESRLSLWKNWSDDRRLEIATGFHASTSHVASSSANSRIYSADWLAAPFPKLEISGTYLHGQNFASLGALSSGFSIAGRANVVPIRSNAGWTQFSVPFTRRLTLNLFGGFQSNNSTDILPGDVQTNFSYAGNLMYHLTQNVVFSFEGLQMRSQIKQNGDLIRNRYDLAVAYLF